MKLLYFLIFLLTITTAHAQDCGGMANAGGGCVPPDVAMPRYQQQAPQPPPQVWENYWGAISTDTPKGILGSTTSASSQADAEQSSIANCRSKGGAQCKLQISFRNGCAAIIIGDKSFNIQSASTLDMAIQKGMTIYTKTNNNCHVYYSICSLPVRIQ